MTFVKYKRTVLTALFYFILGCSFTTFFMKIDDSREVSRSIAKKEATFQVQSVVHDIHYTMIVLIVTSPHNMDQRSTIRNTWLNYCNGSSEVRCMFFIGTKSLEEAHIKKLTEEQDKYNDLVLLKKITDSYDTLSDKVLASFVWVNEHIHNYQFVLKCDDDSFVLVNNILAELKTQYNNSKGPILHWGFFDGRAHVKKKGKWQEKKWNLCDRYLPYALGGGYILGQKLVKYISKNSQDLMTFANEDVSVGIWLAPIDVHRQHDIRFDTEYLSRGCSNHYLITHKKTPENMASLYDSLQKTQKLCEKEFISRLSYVYNWTVPPSQCCVRTKDRGVA